jgi:hypothetical protein
MCEVRCHSCVGSDGVRTERVAGCLRRACKTLQLSWPSLDLDA